MASKVSLKPKTSVGFADRDDDDSPPAPVPTYEPDIVGEVDERLGLLEPGELAPQVYEQRIQDACAMMGAVWDFCFENGKGKFVTVTTPQQLQVVLRRFLVLTLMFRADRLADHTLRSLCQLLPREITADDLVHLSRVPVSKIGIEASKRFGMKTRLQKPEESIKVYAKAAVIGHKKRKVNILKQKACQAAAKAKKGKAHKK